MRLSEVPGPPAAGPAPEPATWQHWEAALVDAVLALPDGGSVSALAALAQHAR